MPPLAELVLARMQHLTPIPDRTHTNPRVGISKIPKAILVPTYQQTRGPQLDASFSVKAEIKAGAAGAP
jgi:hypothetical protein